MTNTARNLMTGLTFTVTLFTAGQALAAQDGGRRSFSTSTTMPRIAPEDLSAAEDEATRIYASAGVRTVWATGTNQPRSRGCMCACICSPATWRRSMIKTARVADGVLGQAARPGWPRLHLHPQDRQNGDAVWRRLHVGARTGHGARSRTSRAADLRSRRPRHHARGPRRPRRTATTIFTTEQGAAIRSMLLAGSRLR